MTLTTVFKRVNAIMPYLLPVLIIAAGIVYYYIDPQSDIHPIQCSWRLWTGTSCPSCGGQRALHALVHGQWAEAWHYNLFFVVSIPYALAAIASTWYNYHHRLDWLHRAVRHPAVYWTYVVLFFVWWVVRNVLDI